MDNPWIAALVALFVWWFATGAILWAVKRADRGGPDAHLYTLLLSLPLLFFGVVALTATLDGSGPREVYLGFLSALAIWGWIEISFLAGIVTGPNRSECPPGLPLRARFAHAWGIVAYHEVLLTAALALIVWLSREAANTVALWTFVVLYLARISAKLNLFLGVPRINVEFLPLPLSHVPSHFRIARLNWLFPVSVTVLSLATSCWLERLHSTGEARFALLAALTGLALLEHWLMVLPLPDQKLWRWMIPAPRPDDEMLTREKTHGL
ncbi:putative photosynthetic complex assembly protein PuhE [Tranquillimonas alkanivorans]|uniref:Putative photosynthetic complex assembly protein 2 n=1 Tax=Tranquillimonas alkanivorans TaxID=441119 RepID=A0A1I5LCH2_9RHOB|nr:putative photosynthetic complex assembly protein PuhE [Tranquillimonas alkanivorans]SFO94873.1 putative photosynthetic complex assembly protein 2 [Tranquillimonas alkanivorans]